MYIIKENITEYQLNYLENNILKFKLPPKYRTFLLNTTESLDLLDIIDLSSYGLRNFVSYSNVTFENFSTLENLSDAWRFNASLFKDEGLMPIAGFEGGTTLSVGINKDNLDKIFYWDVEINPIYLCQDIEIFCEVFRSHFS